MTKQSNRLHIFFLFMAALLWGTTFVAQRMGSDYVEPFTYLAARSWVAVVFLTPLVHIMDRVFDRRGIDNRRPRTAADRKLLLVAGCISGTMLCAASATQQIGIAYTTASKAGFITALYVVLVPMFSIALRKRPSPHIWFCVAVALVGLYLLCMTSDRFTLEYGDAWELVCAFLYAIEILILFHFSSLVDAVRLSRMQFLVGAIISTVFMLLLEHPTAESFRLGLPAILYAGIVSSGIAYTLQIFGQNGVNPTVASLVMSLESVFSALSGWLVLHEHMSVREFGGAALMFLAIVLSQLDFRAKGEQAP